MEQFKNVETSGLVTSAIFITDSLARANMLRRAILTEIDAYAIEFVVFHVNTTVREDEILALRLGQCVIDHTRFVAPAEPNYRYRVDFTGPGDFTTDHVVGIPFTNLTPIAELLAGQRILCDVIVRQGRGRQHVKWRPVSTVEPVKQVDGGYLIKFRGLGMMPPTDILAEAVTKIEDAAGRPAKNIFFSSFDNQ